MPQPAEIAAIEEPLLRAYAQAWERIVAEQAALADDPRRFARSRRLAELRQRVEESMDVLDSVTATWIRESLPQVYALGGVTGVAEATGGSGRFVWTQIHQDAVQQLATGIFHDLLDATSHVRRTTKVLIRGVARDVALKKAIEGRTAVDAGREMRRILNDRGIWAVVYKDGSNHGLREYGQMVMRTTTAKAYNEGTLNGAEGEGVKYWEVFDGPNCGWSFHEDPDLALGKIVPKDEALTYIISHPNCRRSFGARPELRTNTDAKKAEPSVNVEALVSAGEGGEVLTPVPESPSATKRTKEASRGLDGAVARRSKRMAERQARIRSL